MRGENDDASYRRLEEIKMRGSGVDAFSKYVARFTEIHSAMELPDNRAAAKIFTIGLHEELRKAVSRQEPRSIREAAEQAIKISVSLELADELRGNSRNGQQHPLAVPLRGNTPHRNHQVRKCYNCGGHEHLSKECRRPPKAPVPRPGGSPNIRNPEVSPSSRRCHICGKEDHLAPACPAKQSLKCFTCGEVGHKSPKCPKNKRKPMPDKRYNYGRQPEERQFSHLREGNTDVDSGSAAISDSPLPVVTLQSGPFHFSALMDTGAEVNVVSPKMIQQLSSSDPNSIRYTDTQRVILRCGQARSVTKEVVVKSLKTAGKELGPITCAVLDCGYDVILGIDIFGKRKTAGISSKPLFVPDARDSFSQTHTQQEPWRE